MGRRPGKEAFTAHIGAALIFLLAASAGASEVDPNLAEQLHETSAINMQAVLAGQFEDADPAITTFVGNPYLDGHREIVDSWAEAAEYGEAVCALRFVGASRTRYEIRNFSSARQAEQANFTITHFGRCGSCSTLSDLAVYLEHPDLTTPARRCARKWGFNRVRQCFEEEIGFTVACAASWAHNALNTRQQCRAACIETYGLFNLLFHRYPAPNNRDDGSLNACLQCDEGASGPGFRYSAGRTRRNSGIESAIQRPGKAIQPVDHSLYFTD